MGLELGKGPGALPPAVPQDPGHRQLGVVVEDALGRPAQEGKGRDVAVQEGLGGLRRVGLDEASVAVGQVQDKVVGLLLYSADYDQSLAEVALGVARRVGERHEHFLRPPPMLPHVVLDRGVSPTEPVLVPEPLKDALGRVALLSGDPVIIIQDAVDDAGVGLQLGAPGRSLPPVARRRRVGQHLAHRVPVQTEHPGGFPNAHPLHHHPSSDPQVHVHLEHPSHHP